MRIHSFFPSDLNRQSLGTYMPIKITSIEVNSDKSVTICKSMHSSDKSKKSIYEIKDRSHIEIALQVLSGKLCADKGLCELCANEGTNEKWHVLELPLGQLLGSLVPQSKPNDIKIKYITDDELQRVTRELGPLEKKTYNFSL